MIVLAIAVEAVHLDRVAYLHITPSVWETP